MGMSRDTFYRYQQAAEQGGVEALLNQNRCVPNSKNCVVNRTWEELVAEKGIILSESQVQALERKKEDDIACG